MHGPGTIHHIDSHRLFQIDELSDLLMADLVYNNKVFC
jgi:hypothetical protein